MGGDDARPYQDETYFSEHTAMAFSRNTGQRRGYFGEYLWDMPAEVWVKVVDRAGQPLSNVTVTAYQTKFNIVDAAPAFQGQTDYSGVYRLPNRPVTMPLTTATDHTLRPNPFGTIDVVGRNAQLLLHLSKGGEDFFSWLPITELNKAAWREQESYTITLATHFAGDTGALAVPRLTVQTTGVRATLSWAPVPGAVSYNIYQGQWPAYYPFTLLAEDVKSATYAATLSESARFAVTAVGSAGESAFSNIVRAELLLSPQGLVWENDARLSSRGQLLVVDGHFGSLLQALPPAAEPFRWVGRVGSEHISLVGAVAATSGPAGVIGIAQTGGRVWVLDSDQRPLNWVGRVDDIPAVTEHPLGLALAGEPFTFDIDLARPDPDALLLLPFDDRLDDIAGIAPETAEGVRFVSGRFGQAVEIQPGGRLLYPAPTGFNSERGGLEFWVRPNWPATATEEHVLLEIGDPDRPPEATSPGYSLALVHVAGGLEARVVNFDDFDKAAWGEVTHWQPGEWHHVAVTWDEQRLNLHVDGRLAWAEGLPVPISGQALAIAVGSTLQGEVPADAAFDSLRISRYPRLGNSERFRMLVSEEDERSVSVLDLLGNRVSTYELASD